MKAVIYPPMRLPLQKLRAQAARVRTESPDYKDGWVVICRGKIDGWASVLEEPQRWIPEVVFVPEGDAPVLVTAGGDDRAGATTWVTANDVEGR